VAPVGRCYGPTVRRSVASDADREKKGRWVGGLGHGGQPRASFWRSVRHTL